MGSFLLFSFYVLSCCLHISKFSNNISCCKVKALFVVTLFPLCVLQIWANYEEKAVEEVVHLSEEKERVANYRPVFVTEISDNLHFYAQDVETGTCILDPNTQWTTGIVLRNLLQMQTQTRDMLETGFPLVITSE